jgi:hypothetical protein
MRFLVGVVECAGDAIAIPLAPITNVLRFGLCSAESSKHGGLTVLFIFGISFDPANRVDEQPNKWKVYQRYDHEWK